jgi:hypothetical protein
MLDWFLHVRRTSIVRSDGDCDAEVLCIGVLLLSIGVALL